MALIYQISLNGSAYDARDKDWDTMVSETGCKPRTGWVDPLLGRPLLKGEFGCSVSHLRVWEKIASGNLNGIILEEDAVFDEINPYYVDHMLERYDSVWLGYNFNDLGYWYNCHAYAITPETAKLLIEGFSDDIIPVDEWVPAKLASKRNFFFEENQVGQIPREIRPSTIEDTEMLPDKDINMHIITVATDESRAVALKESADKFGITVYNLGADSDWYDPMEGHAGMPKIDLTREFVKDLPADDIVLFMDAYDTFFADDPITILERFYDFNTEILFGAERDFWPPDTYIESRFPEAHTPYKYLNSGLYMGYAGALTAFFDEDGPSTQDDQRFCQMRYLKTIKGGQKKGYYAPYKVALDHDGYIFQNHEPLVERLGDQIYNPVTNTCGCIYHGNGGTEAKLKFKSLCREFGIPTEEEKQPVPYLMTLDYEEVAPEILVTDFLTDRQCEWLIHKSEEYGNWGELQGDKFPAQEIRIKQLGLWDEYERLWHEKLGKIAMKHWQPYQHLGLRDAFTMKYTMDTQKALGWHTDASLVTGSVKLNDNYEGAELVFPRQDFSNLSVPKGKCILFPSDVTHGHYVPELKSGVKYSLTMWTSRHEGDVN